MNQMHRFDFTQPRRADCLHGPVEEAVARVVRGGEKLQVPPEERVLAHVPPLPALELQTKVREGKDFTILVPG